MISGAHDAVDLFFVDVRFLSLKADLVTALIVFPIALDHREVRVAGGVVVAIVRFVVLDGILGAGTIEGARHSGSPVGFVDARVAIRAQPGIYVIGWTVGGAAGVTCGEDDCDG